VDLTEPFPMDDPSSIPALLEYGQQMGQMVLDDAMDSAATIKPAKARRVPR